MDNIVKRAQKLLDEVRFSTNPARKMEDFIREELFTELNGVSIEIKDIMEIYSLAATYAASLPKETEINETNIYVDPKLLQAYCYTLAIVSKFKAKGAILQDVEYGTQKDKMKRDKR
jgi:hypothetical protein